MRRENEKPIGEVLNKLFEVSHLEDGLWEERIREFWSTNMPEMIRNRTGSLHFCKGKLSIVVNSAALRNEFNLTRDELRAKINAGLGREIVAELELR